MGISLLLLGKVGCDIPSRGLKPPVIISSRSHNCLSERTKADSDSASAASCDLLGASRTMRSFNCPPCGGFAMFGSITRFAIRCCIGSRRIREKKREDGLQEHKVILLRELSVIVFCNLDLAATWSYGLGQRTFPCSRCAAPASKFTRRAYKVAVREQV